MAALRQMSGPVRLPSARAAGFTYGSRWRSHPVAAAALQALAVLVPAGVAVGVLELLNCGLAPAGGSLGRFAWWGLLLAVVVVAAATVQRLLRRLRPLVMLLRLTLLFPESAPSRRRLNKAAANPVLLQELVAGGSPRSRAATQVLAGAARLAKHDRHARGHAERVRIYTDLLAEQLDITGIDRDKLRWAALLHDLGKLRVPTGILGKPVKPSRADWDVLANHPATGVALLGPFGTWLGPWVGGIADHHERFDGGGYPAGLVGDEISLAGRIVAVADAYEAMTTARPYHRPAAARTARLELARCAGSQFDPKVTEAFLAIGLRRMLTAVGPLSFLAHLPVLAKLRVRRGIPGGVVLPG